MIADLPPRALTLLTEAKVKPARAALPAERIAPTTLTTDHRTQRRILAYTDRVGYGLSDGRKTSAYRLACFYLCDVGLSFEAAAMCLQAWNDENAPPLPTALLADILRNASKYARGAA